jgi:hypothetical protein
MPTMHMVMTANASTTNLFSVSWVFI